MEFHDEKLDKMVVKSLSCVQLFAAHQAFIFISWSLLKFMSFESVMSSNHHILCCFLLLLPSIFLSIRVFSSESTFLIRCPMYWSFSFSISPSNEYSGLISFMEKEMAIHSSTLAWKIPRTEEPDRLQSTGSQRVGYGWATSLSYMCYLMWQIGYCKCDQGFGPWGTEINMDYLHDANLIHEPL